MSSTKALNIQESVRIILEAIGEDVTRPGLQRTPERVENALEWLTRGYRSSVAASLLQRHGFSDVSEIAGGLAAWEAAGLPVAKP